jgi:hypothetical protein
LCRMGDEDHPQDDYWAAEQGEHRGVGQTPLIAAMRCYVESKAKK